MGRAADILLTVTRFLTLARRTTLLLLAVATPVLVAVPARADVPEGWSGTEPEQVDTLHALLVLAGIPLLLFVLIAIAVYVPALIRGERVTPGAPAIESQWFGGPRSGTHELGSGSSSEASDDTGGASGRW